MLQKNKRTMNQYYLVGALFKLHQTIANMLYIEASKVLTSAEIERMGKAFNKITLLKSNCEDHMFRDFPKLDNGHLDVLYGELSDELRYDAAHIIKIKEKSILRNLINKIDKKTTKIKYSTYSIVDPTKMSITEEEFIQICQQGLQAQMSKGAIITLSNTEQTQWEVIGVNHDNTENTVDIMSHTNIHYVAFGSSQYYFGSDLQKYCNETIPNAFINPVIKSLIKTMDVKSNGSTLTGQKGKALSCTELGYSDDEYASDEGTSYGLAGFGYRSGVASNIWTRSRYIRNGNIAWWVLSSRRNNYNYGDSNGALPVLRF